MSAQDLNPAALDALTRSDDDLPAEPADLDLIARLDAACRASDGRRLEQEMAKAEQEFAERWQAMYGTADDEEGDE